MPLRKTGLHVIHREPCAAISVIRELVVQPKLTCDALGMSTAGMWYVTTGHAIASRNVDIVYEHLVRFKEEACLHMFNRTFYDTNITRLSRTLRDLRVQVGAQAVAEPAISKSNRI